MTMLSRKTDDQIRDDVMRELRWDTRVNADHIKVAVASGVVTLTGAVESWSKRVMAAEAAHRVGDVLDVANDLEVRPADALSRSDTDIARAVRQALEWDVRVPDTRIRSTVSNGHVKLEGDVTYWTEREDAESAVRNLAGVMGVTNALLVKGRPVAESEVRDAIFSALQRHAAREARHIELGVFDGKVTLTGTVHSWAERQAAVGAAGATPGVRVVQDLLKVAL